MAIRERETPASQMQAEVRVEAIGTGWEGE
jgi:hypothetical protein